MRIKRDIIGDFVIIALVGHKDMPIQFDTPGSPVKHAGHHRYLITAIAFPEKGGSTITAKPAFGIVRGCIPFQGSAIRNFYVRVAGAGCRNKMPRLLSALAAMTGNDGAQWPRYFKLYSPAIAGSGYDSRHGQADGDFG